MKSGAFFFLFALIIIALIAYKNWNENVPEQEGSFSILSAEFKEGRHVGMHGAGGHGKPVIRTMTRQRIKRLKNQPRYELEMNIEGTTRKVVIPQELYTEGQEKLNMRYKLWRNGMVEVLEIL